MSSPGTTTKDPKANVDDLIHRYFPSIRHPYRIFARAIDPYITEGKVVLKVGCGRTAPMLSTYKNRGAQLMGIDLVEFDADPDLNLISANISDLSDITTSSIDLI